MYVIAKTLVLLVFVMPYVVATKPQWIGGSETSYDQWLVMYVIAKTLLLLAFVMPYVVVTKPQWIGGSETSCWRLQPIDLYAFQTVVSQLYHNFIYRRPSF